MQFKSLLTAALLAGACNLAHATVVEMHFGGMLDSGPDAGAVYNGTVAWDDAGLTGSGDEYRVLTGLTLDFMSNTYDLGDAFYADAYYLDGVFAGVDALLDLGAPAAFSLVPGLVDVSDAYVAYVNANDEGGFGSITYASVETLPLPGTAWLLFGGLAALGGLRRDHRA